MNVPSAAGVGAEAAAGPSVLGLAVELDDEASLEVSGAAATGPGLESFDAAPAASIGESVLGSVFAAKELNGESLGGEVPTAEPVEIDSRGGRTDGGGGGATLPVVPAVMPVPTAAGWAEAVAV